MVNPRIRTLFLEKSITYFRISLIQRVTKVSNTFFRFRRPIFEALRWVWRGWPGLGRAQMETRIAAGGWYTFRYPWKPVEPGLHGASTRPPRILRIIGTLFVTVEARGGPRRLGAL